jgi:hypothetical protein
MTELEKYFYPFRKNIIGIDTEFVTPDGIKKILYADWIASGRLKMRSSGNGLLFNSIS